MPLKFVTCDITKIKDADAIVNSANSDPEIIGGGVEEAIFEAAGKDLIDARRKLGTIPVGKAVYTDAFNLNTDSDKKDKIIIHTVAFPWCDGKNNEIPVLRSCYMDSLRLAKSKKCKKIAFPFIGTGSYGYPAKTAFDVAVETISGWLESNSRTTVYLCIGNEKLKELADSYILHEKDALIDENYLVADFNSFVIANFDNDRDEHEQIQELRKLYNDRLKKQKMSRDDFIKSYSSELKFCDQVQLMMADCHLDKKEVLMNAGIKEDYYSKFVSGERIPSRGEVMSLALAMHLDEDDFRKLLASAKGCKANDIQYLSVLWNIRNKDYDIASLNSYLISKGEKPLTKFIVQFDDYSDLNDHH